MYYKFQNNLSIYNNNNLERRVFLKKCLKNNQFKPALFLDRDGVIIEDKHYLRDPEDVYLCKNIRSLLNIASKHNWYIVVVTNQSGISRKNLSWNDFDLVNQRMVDLLGSPFFLTAIYANGHLKSTSEKSWRKPNPGMIVSSANELSIDLEKSIMVGDRLSDIEAGAKAGIKKLVHVLTGHGKDEREMVSKNINKSGKFVKNGNECNIELINDLDSFPYIYFDN